jgi:hypothetical protein
VWQDVGQNFWVGPDRIERVEAHSGPVRLVLEVTSSREGRGGETKTAVDEEGKPRPATASPRGFRTMYRFVIYPERNWFESRLAWIVNTDVSPWTLAGYYHYTVSKIGGDAGDDEAAGNRWVDEGSGACLGVVPASDGIDVHFWKDKAGGEHPDACRKVGLPLEPGGRYPPRVYDLKAEPAAYVVGCRTDEWAAVEEELKGLRAVLARAFEPERR